MRLLFAAALMSLILPTTASAQESADRREIAMTVLTLDTVRQGQADYGRRTVDYLGSERAGVFRWNAPAVAEADVHCEDEFQEESLARCVRFYLREAVEAGTPSPAVVVVLDDLPGEWNSDPRWNRMRAFCFGSGEGPTDATAQSITLWPQAARMHGTRDLEADRAALTACVQAAAAEAR